MSCWSIPRTRSCTTSARSERSSSHRSSPRSSCPTTVFSPMGGWSAPLRWGGSADRVVLASGGSITADYFVLATGSTYPFPAKTDAHAAADAIDNYRAAYHDLTHADRVLLIGAGPVGIELAGEIVAKWAPH